jgi:hypothetical protein
MGFTQQPTQYNCNILEQNVKTEKKKKSIIEFQENYREKGFR